MDSWNKWVKRLPWNSEMSWNKFVGREFHHDNAWCRKFLLQNVLFGQLVMMDSVIMMCVWPNWKTGSKGILLLVQNSAKREQYLTNKSTGNQPKCSLCLGRPQVNWTLRLCRRLKRDKESVGRAGPQIGKAYENQENPNILPTSW